MSLLFYEWNDAQQKWRVATVYDDFVAAFPDKEDARDYCHKHNRRQEYRDAFTTALRDGRVPGIEIKSSDQRTDSGIPRPPIQRPDGDTKADGAGGCGGAAAEDPERR